MKTSGTYIIDHNTVLLKAYRLLCLFFGNKEIARRSDPESENAPLRLLERRFFESEASMLLIEIAVALRVLDDQIRRLPIGNDARDSFERKIDSVKNYNYGLFDELDLDLRKTCNKIIHSDVMEPHTKEGWEPHEFDSSAIHDDEAPSIDWIHLSGYVRLCGKHRGKFWYVLLDVEVFVTAVVEVLGDFD